MNYDVHLRFKHAHHETKDWLPSLGSRGSKGDCNTVL